MAKRKTETEDKGSKRWFIMADLSTCDFTVYDDGWIGDVTGYKDYMMPFQSNGFKTKKQAATVSQQIKNVILKAIGSKHLKK